MSAVIGPALRAGLDKSDGRPPTLLMTADTVGGVWTYAIELCRQLARHGVRVTLATMGRAATPDQRSEARVVPHLVLIESDFKLEWMDDPWDDVAAAGQWLLKLERRVQPDVVHLNGYAHAALPWQAPNLVVGHSCVLSWWQAVKGQTAPASWNTYRREVAAGLRAAQVVVAPTAAMRTNLEVHYAKLLNTAVIHNACDAAAFEPGEKQPYLFAAGRLWDEAKNLAAVAAVAPCLDWPVYVAGESAHPNGGSIRQRGVRLLGRLPRSEVARWLAEASIYVHPARYEPFGLSVLEAALSGCALVLGDIPTLREVWGEAAVYVPPNDHHALRGELQSLIASPERRQHLARLALKRAQRYSPQRMAARYLDLYCRMSTSGIHAPLRDATR